MLPRTSPGKLRCRGVPPGFGRPRVLRHWCPVAMANGKTYLRTAFAFFPPLPLLLGITSRTNQRACESLFAALLCVGGWGQGRKWSPNQTFLLRVKSNNTEKKKNKSQYLLSSDHVPNAVRNTLHVLTHSMQCVRLTGDWRQCALE